MEELVARILAAFEKYGFDVDGKKNIVHIKIMRDNCVIGFYDQVIGTGVRCYETTVTIEFNDA